MEESANKNLSISVVTTCYNSEYIIDEFVAQVSGVVKDLTNDYEIILVDDGSPDKSWLKIQETCLKKTFVKGVKLSRNFGQQIAMSAGIESASKDVIIIMDGDLQNPPEAIKSIVDRISNGIDLVYTVDETRNNFFNELTSKIFWFILTKLLAIKIVKNQLMMKGFTREIALKYSTYREINRTVAGIILDIGYNYDVIKVKNTKRHSGKSNYNFFKRFNLMVDVVISMSSKPISLMIYLGFFIFTLSILYAIYMIVMFTFEDIVPGFTSIITLISFFGGITIMMLGFMGKYLSNIYDEVKNRPLFTIQKKVNFNE